MPILGRVEGQRAGDSLLFSSGHGSTSCPCRHSPSLACHHRIGIGPRVKRQSSPERGTERGTEHLIRLTRPGKLAIFSTGHDWHEDKASSCLFSCGRPRLQPWCARAVPGLLARFNGLPVFGLSLFQKDVKTPSILPSDGRLTRPEGLACYTTRRGPLSVGSEGLACYTTRRGPLSVGSGTAAYLHAIQDSQPFRGDPSPSLPEA